MSDEHLLPMQDEEDGGGFDKVLRGYDIRQVDDYVERVEIALGDADRQHGEDGRRIAELEQEAAVLRDRLADAEHRAAGLPEPSSRVAARAAEILRLAEEEADQLVDQARARAENSVSDLTAELNRRSEELSRTQAEADGARLDAQRDAEAVRTRAKEESSTLVTAARADAEHRLATAKAEADEHFSAARAEADRVLAEAQEEAERKLRTAEEDVAIVHEDGRAHAKQLVEDARAQVEDLARQRDAIAAQLQQLRETLGAALNPPTQ